MSRIRTAFHNPSEMEKGLPSPAMASSASAPSAIAAGRPKRRRMALLIGLAFLSFCLYMSSRDSRGSGIDLRKIAKDAVFHVEKPVPSANDVDKHINAALQEHTPDNKLAAAVEAPERAKDHLFEPTDALRKLASSLHLPLPGGSLASGGKTPAQLSPTVALKPTDAPSHTDRVLLFLTAVKNAAYAIPSDAKQRVLDLQPSTMQALAQILHRVRGKKDEDDSKLYLEAHDSWLAKHRKESPLTVFSKSYCPYSKRAKALLTQMGAQFVVYEVDLREDSTALQQSLRELSGHTTFPAIFVRDELIGGSDDLEHLSTMGVLHGILEAAGVSFAPAVAAVKST